MIFRLDDRETRYANSGELRIAYQVIGGGGPVDVAFLGQWFTNVEAQWDFPPLARFLERLSSFSRVLAFDKRGVGVSDPVPLGGLPTLEEWMDDLRAALDAAGMPRAALLADTGGAYMAMLFAATLPERTSALILVDAVARQSRADDYPWGPTLDELRGDLDVTRERWGSGIQLEFLAPSLLRDPELRREYARYERQTASPSAGAAMLWLLLASDLRPVLPSIRVPTLVIQHADAPRLVPAFGRYVAEHIPGARYVEVPGDANFIWAGDTGPVLDEIQEFLTGVRPVPEAERVLATVLFTDLVGSTEQAAAVGDRRWRHVLEEHEAAVRRELARYRGREIRTEGDAFLATFDGPARAVRCALASRDATRRLGLELRAGLHTGEVKLMGKGLGGIAVHIGARVAAMAAPGEVLVSSTVKDLVVGSGLEFDDRGAHALKGVPGEWRLYAVRG